MSDVDVEAHIEWAGRDFHRNLWHDDDEYEHLVWSKHTISGGFEL